MQDTDPSPKGLLAFLALALSGGVTLVCLGFAIIVARLNCEDGCPPGSRWASGAWGTKVEVWALALPALLAAVALVAAIATGRRGASVLSWIAMMGLLVGWCVFTGTDHAGLWALGLFLAGAGGLPGVVFALRNGKK